MKISACWIVKNEENNIQRSIESLGGMADEIIVVDTGSTDNTVEIAKAAGAVIYDFEWVGDFSLARNYTMSLVSGDILFFLDADEWFISTFTADDRKSLEKIFTEHPEVDAVMLTRQELDGQGAVKTLSTASRILRGGDRLEYRNRIHELIMRKNGDLPIHAVTDKWQLNHTGYADEILGDKNRRNIELLEKSVETATDPEQCNFQHCYLVREYYQQNNSEKSIAHLKIVLEEPDMIRRHCIKYEHGFAPFIYIMMLAASDARAKISRKEIYRKLVDPFRKYLPGYSGVPTIDLFYDILFDIKDDVMLSKIRPAMEAANKLPPSSTSYYREAEMLIYQDAAEASLRFGKLTDVMDYAVASFKHTQNRNARSLHVLLCCMRGLPAEEIILFLNSQFDSNNSEKMEFLVAGTRMYGFRDVHAYYLDKLLNAGLAQTNDYLYLLLLYGQYGQALAKARELYNENNAEVVGRNIFLATICLGDERIYHDNEKYLQKYAHILDAYFSGKPLDNMTNNDYEILIGNFGLIALAAGMERADKLRHIFAAQAMLGFQVKAKYCFSNGLYEDILSEEMPDKNDYLSNMLVIQSLTMTGRCDEAFERIRALFAGGTVDKVFLKYLLAIEYRSQGGTKLRARELYDKYIKLYDWFIDLGDVINTGYVPDGIDYKKAKSLKSLTPSQFNKQVAEDAAKPLIKDLTERCLKAGEIYEEKSMPAMAMKCYRFVLAQGGNKSENYKRLATLFAAMGNYQLSGELNKKT